MRIFSWYCRESNKKSARHVCWDSRPSSPNWSTTAWPSGLQNTKTLYFIMRTNVYLNRLDVYGKKNILKDPSFDYVAFLKIKYKVLHYNYRVVLRANNKVFLTRFIIQSKTRGHLLVTRRLMPWGARGHAIPTQVFKRCQKICRNVLIIPIHLIIVLKISTQYNNNKINK